MIVRTLLMPLIILSSFVLQIPSCRSTGEEPRVEFGPKQKTDLVFFFKKSATQKEVEHFLLRDGLVIPAENGTGFYDPPGMGTGFAIEERGYEGYGINFKKNATDEQREAIRLRVTSSPIVYKVYENVVPAEINDLNL